MTKETTSRNYTKADVLGEAISREEALKLIKADIETAKKFFGFKNEYQEIILAFLQGQRSLVISYDNFFKKIFDVDAKRKRVESLISSLLEKEIHIEHVLPNEGIRMNEKASFVIMDVICRDVEGSIINVEMQKVGYNFPGERAACYNADMIMREYNHLHGELGDKFSYRNMKPVYLIILMEDSPREFKEVSPDYFHQIKHICSSGAEYTELSKTIYVSLDTFNKNNHNIITERDAWLTFLSSTDVGKIVKLVNAYPEFMEIYDEIREFRNNPEELVSMVSEMIATLDHNTIMFMVDEWKAEIEELKAEKDAKIAEKDAVIEQKDAEIAELKRKLEDNGIV